MCNLLLTTPTIPAYTSHAFAKSKASREKLNKLQLANSTPLNRAFFVRIFRTPQENALSVFLSMVERNRKGLALCRFPIVAVSHPVTFYRPTVRSLAVALDYLQLELSIMLYKFLLLGKKRLKIAILANSEQEARQSLNLSPQDAICFARLKGGLYV